MIKIILADDEKLIRAGLKKILLEQIDFPLEITEAKNGGEAFDLCRSTHPDILITDIRMPVMDGVELMKQVSALTEKPAIIVLSGYDDFAYAKAAIQSGAISYILKPVDKKELISAVKSAIVNSLKAEKEQNEQKFRKLLESGRLEDVKGLPKVSTKNGFRCITIYGENPLYELENVMKDKRFYVLEQTRTSICIVYPFYGEEVNYEPSLLDSYVVGVSESAENYSMLRSTRKQAIVSSLQCFFDSENGNIRKEKKRGGIFYYENDSHISDFKLLEEQYEKLVTRCDSSESEILIKDINALFDNFDTSAKLNAETLYYLYRKITENLFTRFPSYTENDMYLHLKGIMIERILDFQTLTEWKNSVRDYVLYLSALLKANSANTKESPYIAEAIEWTKTHFTKNINMATVANQVSVNYTWFSEKFKEHTGVNFNEYLKRLRIDEAKRLLEQGCYKVYEVAARSGFSDTKYFMKLFREETGMSPTEWKTQHRH